MHTRMAFMVRATVAALLVIVSVGVVDAQSTATSLRGSWSATIGTRGALQGTWTAVLEAETPNAATGTWTMVGTAGQVVARGTWAANRNAGLWTGTWSARAANGSTRSGTWRVNAVRGPKTFAELLESTLETQLTGAWSSAGLQGRWAMKASR
jgi:hypothetical protein